MQSNRSRRHHGWLSPRAVATKWSKTQKTTAVVAAVVLAFIAFFAVVIVDGESYDRWRQANQLRMLQQAWLRDGSPEPPQVERYVGPSASSTSFVYTASHVIDGRTYQGLFAHRSIPSFGTFVITRSGEVIVVEGSGEARLLKIHKSRGGAW